MKQLRSKYSLGFIFRSAPLTRPEHLVVLVEAVQVLSSKALYNRPRAEIAEKLGVIIGLKGLKLPNKSLYLFALDLYAATAALDFVDALVVAHMQHAHISTVVSFDRDFDRVPGIRRRDP